MRGAAFTLYAMKPFITALLCFGPLVLAAQPKLTVEAGDFDRRDTVVECQLPRGVSGLSAGGDTTLVQHDENGRAWFVVRDLKRGAKKTYSFIKADGLVTAEAQTNAGAVTLSAFGKKALVYRTQKTSLPPNRPDLKPIFERGGYIHPVLSPSGKQITDDYPSNHKHHHGIWFAWTHTEFEGRTPDFWNMGDGKGFVKFVSLYNIWSGPVHAGFISEHRQMDLTEQAENGKPKTALVETWHGKLYAVGNEAKQPYFLFDLEIRDTCAHGPIKLPQYRYGGIGVRGNWAWNGKDKLNFLNSEGSTDRSKGDKNETRGRWAHMGGMLDGALTGIAVLDHPDNVNAPQPQRIHPTEPFLNLAPQQAGDLEITPDKPLTLRYRFVVADGAPDKAELERLWNDYAHPPRVTLE
jgi:hypothetical protein